MKVVKGYQETTGTYKDFGWVAGHKINKHKSMALLYTNNSMAGKLQVQTSLKQWRGILTI